MVPFALGFSYVSARSRMFCELPLKDGIIYGGNSVMRWMAENMAVDIDPAANIKPAKAGSIDAMIAAIPGMIVF